MTAPDLRTALVSRVAYLPPACRAELCGGLVPLWCASCDRHVYAASLGREQGNRP